MIRKVIKQGSSPLLAVRSFIRKKSFFSFQLDTMDCGPACLKMVAKFYGKDYSLDYLREQCFLSREGVSLLSINDAAEQLGFSSIMAKTSINKLVEDCPLPCILHWHQNHFVVLLKIKNPLLFSKNVFFQIADPSHGIITIDKETFSKLWVSTSEGKGTVLLLEPRSEFYAKTPVTVKNKGYKFLFRYLRPYRKYVVQLVVGMGAASVISLVFPFLTQILIDAGINDKNISILKLILFAQIFLFLGSLALDLLRSWLLLHINSRVSLNIISDFLIKLLRLPIKYFDSKAVGDISQRINDHHRIEIFLTGVTLNSLFSFINILIFTCIILFYNVKIFFVFIFLSLLAVSWIFLFSNTRKHLDYKRFSLNRENQDKLFEMITGMQEIKLYGSETPKRWQWEQLQIRSFKLNIKSLALEQYQQSGFAFFSNIKNIIVTYIAANEVINGSLTLGALLSISYIIGQTNGPLEQLIVFVKSAQDARLSLNRLQEIHNKDNEESNKAPVKPAISNEDIIVQNVYFQYHGKRSPFVLKDISMTIPKGKITAIVGTSGSGKTTLLKLLLNFYRPTYGKIMIGDEELQAISPKQWREQCGTVMQEGYIFFDTIENNIVLNGKKTSKEKLAEAIRISNLEEYIKSIPLGASTKIGSSGIGISGGQKQRILIARSVYKNPNYLFFDEATSSLDANNEQRIMDSLNRFFVGKTVVIIAHRLSTVKNADQIIVLEKGEIVEVGDHHSLTGKKGKYFELVKNQLELGD